MQENVFQKADSPLEELVAFPEERVGTVQKRGTEPDLTLQPVSGYVRVAPQGSRMGGRREPRDGGDELREPPRPRAELMRVEPLEDGEMGRDRVARDDGPMLRPEVLLVFGEDLRSFRARAHAAPRGFGNACSRSPSRRSPPLWRSLPPDCL